MMYLLHAFNHFNLIIGLQAFNSASIGLFSVQSVPGLDIPVLINGKVILS